MSAPAVVRYRWLLFEFTRREIASRYAGSVSGVAWTFLQPLAQLAIYAVIFTTIFRATVPADFPGVSYTAFVAVALWPWIMFSEALQRGMVAITSNAGLIRKVALPNQLFVFSAVIACYAVHVAGFLVVLAVLRLMGEHVRLAGIPFALFLLAPYFLLAAGVALVLAAMQTLLKDVEHGTGIVLSILFYATPILYPLSLAPAAWRGAMLWNPLAALTERLRQVLIVQPGLAAGDFMLWLVALAVFAAGLWIFERLSPHFEDFL
jgi:lipopolysaccharide transport system permease protein